MSNDSSPRIVIICGNIVRDYAYQSYLKKTLEAKFPCNVTIIGSLADYQRTVFLLHIIQPHIVLLPQVQEQSCRSIAAYVKESGGTVCVLPSEITYSTTDNIGLINKRISFNRYVDYFFIPGRQMYSDMRKDTDIVGSKLFVTGHPKTDIVHGQTARRSDTKSLLEKYAIHSSKKTIGIFTSFISTPLSYVKREVGYTGQVRLIEKRNAVIMETKSLFIRDIARVAKYFPEYQFVLKVHPLEDMTPYKHLASVNIAVLREEPISSILPVIRLGIHTNSTTATECWVADIPTILYVPNVRMKPYLSDFNKANPIIFHADMLSPAIKKYMTTGMEPSFVRKQKAFLRYWYFHIDGKASQRIAAIMKRIPFFDHLHYRYINPPLLRLFLVLEKIAGPKLSRRLVALWNKNYNWKYAADNLIYD